MEYTKRFLVFVVMVLAAVPFVTMASSYLYVGNNGSVGIGNESPAAKLDVSGAMYSRLVNVEDTASTTIDWSDGNVQSLFLEESDTNLSFTNPRAGGIYKLILKQDSTGSRTVSWPNSVLWEGGVEPTLTTDALGIDMATFVYDDSNYLGTFAADFSSDSPSGIAFDNSEYPGATGGTPASGSFSETIGSVSNGVIVCTITGAGSGYDTMSQPSATVGSTSMSYYGDYRGGSDVGHIWVFYLTNPPSGSQTVGWAQGTNKSTYIVPMCASYSGVNQTTPIRTSASNYGYVSSITATGSSLSPTDWGVIFGTSQRSLTASTHVTAREGSGDSYFLGDSNGVVGSTSYGMTLSVSETQSTNAYAVFLRQ